MTDYAQKQLRDIVFVELPNVGDSFEAKDLMGTVESVKAVSDILSPLSGTIDEINEEIESSPELINEEPYEEGWLLVLAPTNLEEELGELMDFEKAVEYHKKLVEEA
jgi:glycine cleavage system H protein